MKIYPWLLLHPNIPKPLHGLAPRTILGHVWWGKTKRDAKAKLNQHCWACGVHKYQAKYHHWLEAHECYSINYNSGRVEYVGTCALCHACHNYIHDGRMLILTGKGEFPEDKYLKILAHGNQLLKDWFHTQPFYHKLPSPLANHKNPYLAHEPFCSRSDWQNIIIPSQKIQWIENTSNPEAKWQDYHLILNGKRYERKHKTAQDWTRFYQ